MNHLRIAFHCHLIIMDVATFRFQIILLICWVDTILGSKDIVITKFNNNKKQEYCNSCLSCESPSLGRSYNKVVPKEIQEIDCQSNNQSCGKPKNS